MDTLQAMSPERRARIEQRVLRDWGVELPDSVFRFWAFLGSLGPDEQRAFMDMGLSLGGVMDLFSDPDARPREGIDVRAHGRFYRDPPEFLTFMHGGSDGLHYGLWFDDGRTCSGVASYYNNDGGGIDRRFQTPLEAVRDYLERCWSDLDDDDQDDADVAANRTRMSLLRPALTAFETANRTAVGLTYSHRYDFVARPVDPDRITTLDSAGALVTGGTALERPPHNGADESKFATYMYGLFEDEAALEEAVAKARRRCAAGDPTEALVLGRDLHWASGDDAGRERLGHELLTAAYRALDRPALAEIADAHHRHRDLPRVDVLEPKGA